MNKVKRHSGMSLVEVILALAIFGIIMVAFLSMFTGGIIGIYGAGDKGVAYNLAQEDVDTRIASGGSVTFNPLTVNFGANTFVIEGGFIDASKFFRNKTSELEAFIPILPRIVVTPNVHFEGTAVPFTIAVVGTNTNFTAATKVQVLSRTGALIESINTINYVDATHFSFEITKNLLNSESDYAIKVYTARTGLPDEVVRAKYSVYMPNLIAASNNSIYVSEDGMNWHKVYTITSTISFGTPNATAYGDKRYLVAGSEGKYLLSSEYQGMTVVNTGNDIAINDVTWSNFYKKFFSVNDAGIVRSSLTGDSWAENLPSIGTPLKGISVTESGKILAVGNTNKVYYSSDGVSWTNVAITGETVFNDVFAFDNGTTSIYYVIGNTGDMYYSTDAITWTKKVLTTVSNLNCIEYYLGKLIVVGNNGLILTSVDMGQNWSATTFGTTNYIGATFLTGTDAVFAVGNATMAKSTDFSTWSTVNTLSGETYRAITGK